MFDRRAANWRGFSLVEVTIALAILSYAVVVMVGLTSVGLTSMGENHQRSAETHIMDWAQNTMASSLRASATSVLDVEAQLADENPFEFDRNGLYLTQRGTAETVYQATIIPEAKRLPNSSQELLSFRVVITSPDRGNQELGTYAFWITK